MQRLAYWLIGMGTAATLFGFPLGAQSTRDSAGVLIVENTRPAWGERERLRLGREPRLAIGNSTDSAYRFRQVRGVLLLADGRIAVADGGSMQLRMFSSQGRLLSASEGRGSEPGQLRNMIWVQRLRGDTIAISSGFSTVALYASTGQFVRTTGLPPRAGDVPRGQFLLLTVLNNGLRVAAPSTNPAPRSVGSRWTDSLPLKLATESNDVVRELGTFPYIVFEQGSSDFGPVWLSAVAVVAGGGDRFYIGFGDRYAIRVYADDGTLKSIIRRSWTPTPITDADWERWVVEWSKLWVTATGADRDREVQTVRESPWAEELPAFSQFIVDRGGRLWVRGAHWEDAIGAGSLSDVPAVPSTWSVFDTRGRWLGDVSMPTGFQPFEIGSDYVTGTMRTDGVTRVVIYDLSVSAR